ADMVSIFASQKRGREAGGTIGRIVAGEEQKVDQLAAFGKWLEDQRKLDALFAGEIDVLLDLAQNYAREYVQADVQEHSVVDVLLHTGEGIVLQRMRDGAAR